MAWISITKPNGGDPTEKTLIDAIIDNLTHLFGLAGSTTIVAGANGSFENDTDGDGEPDGWEFAALTNGTGAIYNHTVAPAGSDWATHGKNSFRFVRSLGVGNGGGTLTGDDFFEVTANKALSIAWQMKCSAAGPRVKVEVLWYKRTLAASATASSTVYSSTANPTVWTPKSGTATAPSDAFYGKLKITGGDTTPDVAASIYFDEVLVTPLGEANHGQEFFTATGTWNCTVSRAKIRCWGGGGAGESSTTGGGGGSGEYREGWFDVIPGTAYTVTVGVSSAGAGNVSSVGSLISSSGGAAGSAITGGTGGNAGSGGTVNLPGGDGRDGYSQSGVTICGDGGNAPGGGHGGSRSVSNAAAGQNGKTPGGGGGGGSGAGNGAAGRVIVEW